MQITITTEKRKEVEAIQKAFKQHLSNSVILRSTAQAINGTMMRAIPKINKGVKENYNITQKYMGRIAAVKPKATQHSLHAGIHLRYAPIPVIGFKPKQTKAGIDVAIQKGKTKSIRSAFLASMKSGHTGVFSRGRYQRGIGFVPHTNRSITEIRTASPFSMGVGERVAPQVNEFIGKEVIRSTQGILQAQVSKLINSVR